MVKELKMIRLSIAAGLVIVVRFVYRTIGWSTSKCDRKLRELDSRLDELS